MNNTYTKKKLNKIESEKLDWALVQQEMRNKLGLKKEKKEDEKLISDLLKLMESTSADYTNTFNDLTDINNSNKTQYQNFKFKDWIVRWKERLSEEDISYEESMVLMKKNTNMRKKSTMIHLMC